MRSYKNLSDHDFELLVADLVGAESGNRYEVFARGADLGIDVRFVDPDGAVDVVQCKHMEGSTYAQLRAAARNEAAKLKALDPEPARYRFFTTHSLTASNKTELRGILAPWIQRDDDVVGAEDLELLLNRRDDVERRHIKLWLSSAGQLNRAVNAEIWSRSAEMLEQIFKALPRYVDTGVFGTASDRLQEEKVLVLSGPPGIGKTSMARMLVAEAVALGYEPVEISADVDEGNRILDPSRKQVMLYDDFLGATFLETRLSKNEDKRIASFMARCRHSPTTLFILTTREYILKQALSWYDELDRAGLPLRRMLLELSSYSRREKALILYNHLYMASELPDAAKRSLLRDRAYLKVIDHKNYNPRIIEFVTKGYPSTAPPVGYPSFILSNLDQPEQVWRKAFEHQLDDDSRDIVLLLSTMPSAIPVSELERCFAELATTRRKRVQHGAVRSALQVLDDSLTKSWSGNCEVEVSVANPSVSDFAGWWLRDNPSDATAVIKSALFFEQLDWLRGQVVSPAIGAGDPRHEESLRDAIIRTFGAKPLGLSENRVSNRWYLTYRQSRGVEGRLGFALTADNDFPRLRPHVRFDEWVSNVIQRITESWQQGDVGDLENALALVDALHDRNTLAEPTKHAAMDALRTASTVEEWAAVANFFEDSPGILDADASELADEFESWLEHELTYNLETFSDTDTLGTLENAAERLGVATESALWRSAYEQVSARTDRWDNSSDSRLYHQTARGSADARDLEIDAIFGHLDGLGSRV